MPVPYTSISGSGAIVPLQKRYIGGFHPPGMDVGRIAVLPVVVAAALWGVIGYFTRYLGGCGLDPAQITLVRCAVTAVSLLVVLAMTDREALKVDPRDLWMFIGTGVCSIVFFNVCYFTTIEMLPLSVASVLLYTAPCMVMVMSVAIFGEGLTGSKVLALVSAFAGCILTTGVLGGAGGISPLGILIGLGSGFGYALYSIFGRFAAMRYPPTTVTAYTFIVAAACLLPFSSPSEVVSASSDWKALAVMVALGILCTLIPYVLYTWGLERMDPGKVSVLAFVEPMVATVMGFAVFGEAVDPSGLLGIALILVSVVLLSRPLESR